MGASCASPGPRLGAGSSVLDYIPRAEHLRILEVRTVGLKWMAATAPGPCQNLFTLPTCLGKRTATLAIKTSNALQGRLATKEGDMQLELASRVAQVGGGAWVGAFSQARLG